MTDPGSRGSRDPGTLTLERVSAALGDRYAVERELGRGGMAVVYLAHDRKHEREVAIKVLHPELAAALGAERFLREIRIAAGLQHPHILPLYDSGQAGSLLYYVMPYVRGETLRDMLRREGHLPLEDAVRITREVADGLAHAHEQGIVHRDIKPENVLISGGHAVIADFGIARAVSEAGDDRLTGTGLTVGTPVYMSPEQASGAPILDGRSDVYSLGCVLYELLAGQPPFTGATPQSVIARHVADPVPPVRTVRPQVPASLEAALNQALAKVPADRFRTASHFAAALEARGKPAFGPARPRRFRVPSPGLVVALVAALAAGLLLPRLGGSDPERIRLVVLPFRNLGDTAEDYFSEGITEEITGRLSSIARLGVIARTSAIQYRDADKSIADIGRELGVGFVIEGSVRPAGRATADSLRVSARLIRVADGTQAWSHDYTANREDPFGVQATIAEEVARALDIALGQVEQRQVAARPTDKAVAYDYYLRGNQAYNRSWSRADVEEALAMYERATEADPRYAVAFAQAGKTHVWMYRLGYDARPERLQMADAMIQRAFELDPDLPEAHIARGLYHYWGFWEYQAAIDELLIARSLRPSEAWVYLQIGNIRRRQGEWEDAIENYERAAEFDPRFHIVWFNIGEAYFFTRRYEEADRYYDRALGLTPDFLDGWLQHAAVAVHRGDPERARQILREAESRIEPLDWRPIPGYWLLGSARINHPLREIASRLAPAGLGLDSALYLVVRGETASRLSDTAAARAAWDSARIVLESRAEAQPGQAWIPAALGVALAGLGNEDEAIDAARLAMQITPVSRDAFDGPDWLVNLARVQMMLGRTQQAIDNLELALAVPSRISAAWLRSDPIWDPLRADPRFVRLSASDSS